MYQNTNSFKNMLAAHLDADMLIAERRSGTTTVSASTCKGSGSNIKQRIHSE
jgi:hypothetical protein